MGWFSDKLFGKRKRMDPNKINDFMAPYEMMVAEQESTARQIMDPLSAKNREMRMHMESQAANQGAQAGSQMQKMAAQGNISPAQAMMQSRMAMNDRMSSLQEQQMGWMQGQQEQGMGMLGQVMNARQGIGERQAGTYMQGINASNARRQSNMSMGMSLLGTAVGMSDKRLKTNIELVGKSDKGHNIYEFDYKDKGYGPDRYRGVMAQEVSFASMEDSQGYLFVNYSHPDLDVKFERIS